MPLFRRRRPEPDPSAVPEWASFFDREQFQVFLGIVDITLERLGYTHREWGDGMVSVGQGGEPLHLGLGNLSQLLRDEPEEAWEEIVHDHFSRVASAQDPDDVPWEEAEEMLKLRLWATEDLPPALELVSRPFADLTIVVSLDLPETVATVGRDHAAGWGRSDDELFAIAERNTRAEPDLETKRMELDEGAAAWLTIGDSFFTASQVLWPEQAAGEIPPEGALLAVPNRHAAWIHPIADMRVVGVITTAAQWAHHNYAEGPGAISPHLYWSRGGEVHRIAVDVRDDAVSITPPDAFVEVLDGLAEQGPPDASR